MARFAARKLLHVVLVLFVVSFGLAFLLDLTPGDPAFAILGEQATAEQVATVHKDLKLDDPIYTRYFDWLENVVQGNFGQSYLTKQNVTDQIMERLPVTIEIAVLSLLMAMAASIPIGIFTAYKADGRLDRLWSLMSSLLIALPVFVSALLLVSIFALKLKNFPVHFPATGWTPISENLLENLWYAFLPSLTLALVLIPQYSRLLRADMIATLQEDYILAARAKGVPTRRILLRHALRPSSFSLITLAGVSLGQLIGGAVIVEVLFALPGIGQLIHTSIFNKDVLTVQGVVMFIAIVYVILNTVIDLAYRYLDPRVRARRA